MTNVTHPWIWEALDQELSGKIDQLNGLFYKHTIINEVLCDTRNGYCSVVDVSDQTRFKKCVFYIKEPKYGWSVSFVSLFDT